MASSTGVAYFCTDLSDSPSLPRRSSRRSIEGLEHSFFAGGLLLHFGQHVSRAAVDGLQTDDVLVA